MSLFTRFAAILCLILFSSSGAAQQSDTLSKVKDAKLGSTNNVHQAGKLYLAGQFSKDDIATLKKAGIKKVITLRTEGELEWDENAALAEAGIDLIKIPLRKPETFSDENFDQVRKLLKENADTPFLMHCASANRVGGVWLPYRVLDQGVELEEALKEAKTVGLKAAFIREKALDYIKRNKK